MFARGSRYESVEETTYTNASGRQVTYKLRRALPNPSTLQVHTVVQGDRLDLMAYTHYRDAEQYWRICDANDAMWPEDLLAEIGQQLTIPVADR